MSYTVREVIHHGGYSHQREVTLPDLTDVSLRDLLGSSEYRYAAYDLSVVRMKLAAMRADLEAGQEHRGIGWSTFTMVNAGEVVG